MIKIDKKYKNILELFGCRDLKAKYPNLEEIKTEHFHSNYCFGSGNDTLTYYKCFCGKGTILKHYNYIPGCGSDTWIYCDCKDCNKKLIENEEN